MVAELFEEVYFILQKLLVCYVISFFDEHEINRNVVIRFQISTFATLETVQCQQQTVIQKITIKFRK